MYLLDTDTLVFMLRGNENVARRLDEHATDPRAMSVISYGELLYGASKSARPIQNVAIVRRLAQQIPLVDVSQEVIETFGPLKSELEKSGRRLEDFDLLIASTALLLGYTLVTNNARHFSRIPDLTVENWSSRPKN